VVISPRNFVQNEPELTAEFGGFVVIVVQVVFRWKFGIFIVG
jgi:hypothetical protein